MRITDLLDKRSIAFDKNPANKQETLDMAVDLMCASGKINDTEAYRKQVYLREEESTTGIGEGIAIPHGKGDCVSKPGLAAMVIKNGVDFDSLDGDPVTLLFLIAAPNTEDNVHLEVLSKLSMMLMDEQFTEALRNATSAEEFLSIIDKADDERADIDEQLADTGNAESDFKILAVTACPTGIAHTYMAAEALEKAGAKMGYPLKAETNGSGGAKNVLTDEEIAAADGIIIAADKTVEMARFNGKKLISTKVSDGIKKPEELIQRIIDGDAPVYMSKGEEVRKTSSENESFGRKIYKHLMNGVSHMLPFVVAGGIFIALAFLIDTIAGYSGSASGDFGTITPAAAFFKTIGGVAFNLMVPILAGFIAMSIADRPGLLVGLAGGFLATSGATFALPGGDVPSGFLGGLLAGFAGGFMMLGIEKLCDKLPHALEGIKPVLIYPLLGLGGIAVIMCAINPIMGLINTAMSNGLEAMAKTEGLMIPLCALLAGMMAIDMGGPFNKAAYVFASGMLATATESAYMIMAAVMIGGMVPPIAIALSNTFSKKKWTSEEKKNAPVNYVMGLSFITEGAIPYAAADPLHVIPSCLVGSAAAGALSAFFKCTLMAPHGGVFVFAVVGHWPLYILSLAVGSVVGMLMLGLLKKNINKDQ